MTTALQKQQTQLAERRNELMSYLNSFMGELASVSPKGYSIDKLVQVAGILAFKTPRLLECLATEHGRASIKFCLSQAAGLGCDLNPAMPEGYLIPRNNKDAGCVECTFQVGYQLVRRLAIEAGDLRFFDAELVYEKDTFRMWRENGEQRMIHEHAPFSDRGNIVGVYSVAKLPNGEHVFDSMGLDEVLDIRDRSDSWKYPDKRASSPWNTSFGEMARKTMIKRGSKSLPRKPGESSDRLTQAVGLDNIEYEESDKPRQIDNGTNHGRGQYCSDEEAEAYREAMSNWLDRSNAAWLDRHTDQETGEIDDVPPSLCTLAQLETYLLTAAASNGVLQVDPSVLARGVTDRLIGKYTGILWADEKGQKWIFAERTKYLKALAAEANAKLAAASEAVPENAKAE